MEKINGLEVVVEFQIGTENWGQFRLSPHLSSDFSLEYRAYQTSIYATSAMGGSSFSAKYDGKNYELWNGSWAAVDKNITNFITKFHDESGNANHPETTPHNPWPN
jgi:hypothetical protein